MTHYEKITREEIARRNYTEGTTRAYLRALQDLAGYFQQPPERLTREQIREYTAHLITDRKLSGNTVNQMVGALRFFYLTVLNKPWRGHEMPYPKKSHRLPVIGSPDEIRRLIEAAPTRFDFPEPARIAPPMRPVAEDGGGHVRAPHNRECGGPPASDELVTLR